MKRFICGLLSISLSFAASAQKDPEFPKGWVMYLQAHDGMVTNFTTAPDLFVAGLSLSPQLTVVPGLLRIGGSAGAVFNNKKISGMAGPNLVLKLASVQSNPLGSILNLQLQLEHLWGTDHQKLLGAWVQSEIGQFFRLGFSIHRDYGQNTWWFQGGLGYNLLRKKRKGIEDPIK
jgi:hypothetical protein